MKKSNLKIRKINMLKGPNKYEVELAIDQQKIAQGKIDEVGLSFDGSRYQYGFQKFHSREQAINWIKKQDNHLGYIYKKIRHEQLRNERDGTVSPIEDLFQVFIRYYSKTRDIQRQTLESLNTLQANIIQERSEDATKLTMKFPFLNYANLINIGKTAFQPFLTNERILPIPNPILEEHGYSIKEFGDFIRQSLFSLGGKEISQETAEDIAKRVVVIEGTTGYGSGFIINGRIVTNDHVLRGEKTIRVFNLTGEEIDDLSYSISEKFDFDWDKDIAYIESPHLKKYSGFPEISELKGGYIFGVKKTHRSILPNGTGSDPLSLWISKVDLSDCDINFGKNQGEFTYKDSSGSIPGTSGSIVYDNGIPIGVHGFSIPNKNTTTYSTGYGIFATPEGYTRNIGTNASGGIYFDLPKNTR